MINSLSQINCSFLTVKIFHAGIITKLKFGLNLQKEKILFTPIQFDKFYPKVKGIILRFSINRIVPALKKKNKFTFHQPEKKEIIPKTDTV